MIKYTAGAIRFEIKRKGPMPKFKIHSWMQLKNTLEISPLSGNIPFFAAATTVRN